MARRKKKVTNFTKLILFLLVSTPILYLGISFATGQDGIGNIKTLLGLTTKTDKPVKSYEVDDSMTDEERDEIYRQIEEMKHQLREKNSEIKKLQAELSKIKTDN